MVRRLAAVVCAAVLTLTAEAARGDDEPVSFRTLSLAQDGRDLLVSGAFTDIFDQRLLERLSSGFVTTVVLRAYVYPRGGRRPLGFSAATYRAVYDLWEEIYLVEIHGPGGHRSYRRLTRADALKDITTMVDLPVGRVAAVPAGAQFFVAVVAQVNPVSGELLADVRRWLSRARDRDEVAGKSFFGSFVSVFVNPKLESAESELRFRSQYFYLVAR